MFMEALQYAPLVYLRLCYTERSTGLSLLTKESPSLIFNDAAKRGRVVLGLFSMMLCRRVYWLIFLNVTTIGKG